MPTSQNGWPASRTLDTRAIVINGVAFHVVDHDDAAVVLTYIATMFALRVEPLRVGQCGGYNYRPNVNNPSKLSNHSSATALDINSLLHPNNVPTRSTFTADQIDACHAILDSIPELSEVVHWGGDWFPPLTPDAMHWELHDHDLAKLARVADRIRGDDMPSPKDWTPDDWAAIQEKLAKPLVKAIWDASVTKAGVTAVAARAALRKAAGL